LTTCSRDVRRGPQFPQEHRDFFGENAVEKKVRDAKLMVRSKGVSSSCAAQNANEWTTLETWQPAP